MQGAVGKMKKIAEFKHEIHMRMFVRIIPTSVAVKTKRVKGGFAVYTKYAGFRPNTKLKRVYG